MLETTTETQLGRRSSYLTVDCHESRLHVEGSGFCISNKMLSSSWNGLQTAATCNIQPVLTPKYDVNMEQIGQVVYTTG